MKNTWILWLMMPFWGFAQPNCNAFLYQGDTLQYKACQLVKNIDDVHYQFSREFQELYDQALTICPYFAYAYREKSVAYLKSGDFLGWKKLIDQAVKYDARGNLGDRAWCRYQFFRDYKGALEDFKQLDVLMKTSDIGYSVNGDYHLNIARAICYSALGQKKQARTVIENQLKAPKYEPGLYDFFQLGLLCHQLGDETAALKNFDLQMQRNELADAAYYLCKIYKARGEQDKYQQFKKQALELYGRKRFMLNPYTHHWGRVFLKEIEGA